MLEKTRILLELAKKTGPYGKAIIKTTTFAKELNTTQQSTSRKLRELEEEEYINRTPAKEGFEIRLLDKAKKELESMKLELENIFTTRETLVGTVTTGLGQGRFYTEIPRYKKKIADTLGFDSFPGTLNLICNPQKVQEFLKDRKEITISGFKTKSRTYGDILLFPVNIHNLNAAIIRPKRTNHPAEIIEIIAPFCIRDKFKIKDGDEVVLN
ncbi:MAG: DUF120 domain-containing protein [Nanoarchaeota archaeon]